jgi:diaminopimelate decarboxylase
VSVAALLAEHGSPLWLADVDRARERLAGLRAAWTAAWADGDGVEIAYSYKTNRTTAFLRAFADDGAGAEVVCAAEYALARDVIGIDGGNVVVNGPAKPDALLARAAADGALVIADSAPELERLAVAGVVRAGLRVGLPGPEGTPSRFGIPPADVVAAGRRARELGLTLEVLHVHLVSTDFTAELGAEGTRTLAANVRVGWAKAPAVHAQAASMLAGFAAELGGVDAIDIGGGIPAAPSPAADAHAAAVADALHAAGFAGRLMLEPGRALVADAVDLACTVVAVKTLGDGSTCAVLDAGTNMLPGALWAWPRLEALAPRAGGTTSTPALVAGPLCLNIDVVAPAAALGALAVGDVLIAREVGAYQQVQSTQFGDLRPAVVARDGGTWRLHRRREELSDLIMFDREEPSWSA